MVQRVIALVLAVGFVAAAIFLVPTNPGSAPTPGPAGQPNAGVPPASAVAGEADPAAGVVPTEPSPAEPAPGTVSDLHSRSPDDPPGAASDEVALKCEPLVKRLRAWGGEDLTSQVGKAALKDRSEDKVPALCNELNALGDAELKQALKDRLGVTVP